MKLLHLFCQNLWRSLYRSKISRLNGILSSAETSVPSPTIKLFDIEFSNKYIAVFSNKLLNFAIKLLLNSVIYLYQFSYGRPSSKYNKTAVARSILFLGGRYFSLWQSFSNSKLTPLVILQGRQFCFLTVTVQ